MNLRKLIIGIDTGLYKFRYTNNAYFEQELINHLKNNEINVDNCWCIADDNHFHKLKNGKYLQATNLPINNTVTQTLIKVKFST